MQYCALVLLEGQNKHCMAYSRAAGVSVAQLWHIGGIHVCFFTDLYASRVLNS